MSSMNLQTYMDQFFQNSNESSIYEKKEQNSLFQIDWQTIYPQNQLIPQQILPNFQPLTHYQQDDHINSNSQSRNITPITFPDLKIQGMHIRVHFFQENHVQQFEISEFQITASVKQFIDHTINYFLFFNYKFIPEKIDQLSYTVRLLHPKSQLHQEQIQPHHEIGQYFCQSLIIERKIFTKSNLKRFISLCPDFVIFQIHVPHQKSRHLIKIKRNTTIHKLKLEVLKLCKQQNMNEFILVSYNQMKLINQDRNIQEVQTQVLELLKIRRLDFKAYISQRQNIKNLQQKKYTQPQRNQHNPEFKMEVQINLGLFKGKMRFAIENDEIIERYESNTLTKMIELISGHQQEKIYKIKDLDSVYSQNNHLVLKFQNETKKYRMSLSNQKDFIQQIIRQFRLLKKTLKTPQIN